ncbi:hypothetical protein [Actinoplanes sp. TFC3]|uniref:hypothetical protein n=1 Tax=Actinoplanes sp. TFC3 TaxID=1710355 RepID=UPI000834A6E2|nr:hypothetical protein [Actinoplanes sp. TFC3]
MLAATQNLLSALDPLSYPARMRHLAAWAKSDTHAAFVGAELREQGPYERGLALVIAMATRDDDGIRGATQDQQPSIRASAISAALRTSAESPHRGTSTEIPDLTDLPAAHRRRIYRTLRSLQAPALADAIFEQVRAAHGDSEAAALLPACSPPTVRTKLPDLEHALNPERLVRRHPGLLLERTGTRLEAAAPEHRNRIWANLATAVLQCDPEAVLGLLERYAPDQTLPGALTAYGKIAAFSPHRVLALLLAPARAAWLRRTQLSPALLRRLATLPVADLAPLAQRLHDHPRSLAALLDAVAPARRGELYDAALAEVDTAVLVPTPQVIEVLPAAVRIREATRVLGLKQTRDEEWLVLLWSSFLAWPEAAAALESALRSSDAEERARAYRLLVDAARRSRDPRVVAEVVARLRRLRNEQDPVRAAALTALAGVARLLSADTADGLTAIVTDAVEARDASAASMAALSTLAADTLQHHVGEPALRDWALLAIDLISSGSSVPVLRRFDTVLRRGQEHEVVDRLRPWVRAGVDRGRYGPLFALTAALGKRAWNVPVLQAMLREAIGARQEPVVRQAIHLWLENPHGRADRVAEVLNLDSSTVTFAEVWHTLCSTRTDLLDRVLDKAPRGRFVDRKVRWVPQYAQHLERWLPRQQAAYLALLKRVITDAGAEVWHRATAIHAAARVPVLGRELVLRYVDASEVVIAEAALAALAWSDRPDEALPVLLRYAGGDRARVALYSAGRAARFVAPSTLPALLGAVLTGESVKVTSRKEAARLLARLGPPGVMGVLLRTYREIGTHRDVRAAIVSAARQRLADPDSWLILTSPGSREDRRAVLAATPWGIPERFRQQYAELIKTACRADDREIRRAAFAQLPSWARWTTGTAELVQQRLTDLGEPLLPVQLTSLIPALNGTGLDATFARLIERDAADDDPGGPASDRPARRRLETLARGVIGWSRTASVSQDRRPFVDSAHGLAGHAEFTALAVTMLIGLGRLDNLPEVADRCAHRPALAVQAAELIGSRLRELPEFIDPAVLRSTVSALAARGDLAGGLAAVALVQPGASFGWPVAWRELLLGLRTHPDPDVRDAAYAVDMS